MRSSTTTRAAGLVAAVLLTGCATGTGATNPPPETPTAVSAPSTALPPTTASSPTPQTSPPSSDPASADPALVWKPITECPAVGVVEAATGFARLELSRSANFACGYTAYSGKAFAASFDVAVQTDYPLYELENRPGVQRTDRPELGPEAYDLRQVRKDAYGKKISDCHLVVPLNTGEPIGTKDLVAYRWLTVSAIRPGKTMEVACSDAARVLAAVGTRVPKTERQVPAYKVSCSPDPRAQATELQRYFANVFVDYPEWVDAPNFEQLARPIWNKLKACGGDYALDVLFAMGTPPAAGDAFSGWLD